MGDLGQFVEWLKTRRVDWDVPYRIARIDIVELINHLGSSRATAVTRKRKLAAIRTFLKFLKDNEIIYGNPADTIPSPIRESAIQQYSSRRSIRLCYRSRGGIPGTLLLSCSFYNRDSASAN